MGPNTMCVEKCETVSQSIHEYSVGLYPVYFSFFYFILHSKLLLQFSNEALNVVKAVSVVIFYVTLKNKIFEHPQFESSY